MPVSSSSSSETLSADLPNLLRWSIWVGVLQDVCVTNLRTMDPFTRCVRDTFVYVHACEVA